MSGSEEARGNVAERFLFDSPHLGPAALERKHRVERDPSVRANIMEYLPDMDQIDPGIRETYLAKENKRVVQLDPDRIEKLGAAIIQDDIFTIDEAGSIRHDALKTAFLIFSHLMAL